MFWFYLLPKSWVTNGIHASKADTKNSLKFSYNDISTHMHLNFQKRFTQTCPNAVKSGDCISTMNNVLSWGVSADWSEKSLRERIIREEERKLTPKLPLLLATEAGTIYLSITYPVQGKS